MCNRNNNSQSDKKNIYEKNTRYDSNKNHRQYIKKSRVNASVQSGGTTPIDISSMTGAGQRKEGE